MRMRQMTLEEVFKMSSLVMLLHPVPGPSSEVCQQPIDNVGNTDRPCPITQMQLHI